MQNVTVTVGPTAMSGTGEEGKLPIKGHHKRNMGADLGSIYEAADQQAEQTFHPVEVAAQFIG
jgi:hypothetical protein